MSISEHPPIQQAPATMRAAGPLIISERKEFVPEWCPWRHVTEAAWRGDLEAQRKLMETVVWTGNPSDPETVTSNGVVVTVAHVLPERRFAIYADGRLKADHELARDIELKWVQNFAIAGLKQTGDASLIPKPTSVSFVKWTVDPTDHRKKIKIGFDPNKPAPQGVKPRTLEDAREEPVAEARMGLQPAPDGVFKKAEKESPKDRVQRADVMLAAGALSAEEHRKALRMIAEEEGWTTPEVGVPEGTEQPQESQRVSPGSQSSTSAVSEEKPSLFTETTRCGRTFEKPTIIGARSAKRMHERRCRECIGLDARA